MLDLQPGQTSLFKRDLGHFSAGQAGKPTGHSSKPAKQTGLFAAKIVYNQHFSVGAEKYKFEVFMLLE